MKTIFGAVVALLTAILFVFTYVMGLAHEIKLAKVTTPPPGPNEHVAQGANG